MDYSTIERDYNQSVDNIPTKEEKVHDRDSERKSLTNNRADMSNEINTRNMRGPNTYQPNNSMSLISPSDLPNIDIGFNSNNNNHSQRTNPNNYSNRSYQNQPPLDQPYQPNEPQSGAKNRVNFPSRINKPQQQQQPSQQDSQRYVQSKE